MTHKLLTFCEDYGDEYNVPALACMTNEDYVEWLNTPSGKLNIKYNEQLAQWENDKKARDEFTKELVKRNLYHKYPKDFTPEEVEWFNANNVNIVSRYNKPIKCESNLRAYLGNSSECFEEDYQHLYLMSEFVEAGIVKVFDVSEEFYNTFHKAKLDSLSLCNIFNIKA